MLKNGRWSAAILLAAGCSAIVLGIVVGELTRVPGRCGQDAFPGIGAVPLALAGSVFGVTALFSNRREYRGRRQRRKAPTTWSPGSPPSAGVVDQPAAPMLLTTIAGIVLSVAGLLVTAGILWLRMWQNFCF